MRKFYDIFSSEKLTAMLSKLSWTYFSEVLSLKDEDTILYYLNECINKTLTTRQLHKLIKNIDENETVGIIICKKNNRYVIDYCSDKIIFSREYELV